MTQTQVTRPSGATRAMAMASAVALVLLGASNAIAAGGTVTGKITFKGTPPAPGAPVKVAANPEKCGTEQAPEVLVGPDGAVRWAVVRIVEAKGAWPATAESPVLDQRGCKFVPHVVVVPAGKPLKVLNNDGILHNVHTFPQKNAAINVAQPGFKKTMDATFAQPETVRVGCDVHPWMGAYVVAADTPFVAVTDATGAFTIPDVPPGSYTVSIWHETLGEQTAKVTVAEGQKATVSVAMAAK
jgi:plastocyanin